MPFWDLLTDIHGQGFNRTQAAAIIGMQRRYFSALLSQYRDLNPWGSANTVATYVKDTGEPFRDALLRMQREGYSLVGAARAIGFAGDLGLRYAMKVRGIQIKFTKAKATPTPLKGRGLNVTTGWPTWERVYEILGKPHGPK